MSGESAKKKGVPRWVRWAVSLGLLAWLFTQTDAAAAMGAMLAADPWWCLASWGVMLGLTAYAAVKWWVLMPRGSAGPWTFVRVNFLSNFVGMFLPGIVGVEVARIAMLTKSTRDLAAAFASVMVDRLFGLLSLVALVLVGLWWTDVEVPGAVLGWASVALAGMVAFMVALMSRHCREAVARLMPGALAKRVDKVYECLDLYRGKPWTLVGSAVLAVGFQLGRVLMYWALVRAMGLEVPLSFLVVVVPVAMFVQMLPISIYGLGVREAVVVALLAQAGVPEEEALALSLLGFGVQVAAALPGAVLMLGGGLKAEAAEAEVPEPSLRSDSALEGGA